MQNQTLHDLYQSLDAAADNMIRCVTQVHRIGLVISEIELLLKQKGQRNRWWNIARVIWETPRCVEAAR